MAKKTACECHGTELAKCRCDGIETKGGASYGAPGSRHQRVRLGSVSRANSVTAPQLSEYHTAT